MSLFPQPVSPQMDAKNFRMPDGELIDLSQEAAWIYYRGEFYRIPRGVISIKPYPHPRETSSIFDLSGDDIDGI